MSNVFPAPTEPGFYWAKFIEDDLSEFEPVHVFYVDKWSWKFKVSVMSMAFNLELNEFEWGPKIEKPKELD